MRPFLSARWERVLLVAWAVPDRLVTPLVGPGLRLDRVRGSAVVTLLAYDRVGTRAYGLHLPDGPVLDFRVHVRDSSRRGHVSLRRFGSKRMHAWAWRLGTGESERVVPYGREGEDHVVQFANRPHLVGWSASGALVHPGPGSVEQDLLERRFGYVGNATTRFYRLEHPLWRTWEKAEAKLDVQFGLLLGASWSFLCGEVPIATLLAEGSEVSAWPARAWDGGADDRKVPELAHGV
ncbi:MAG: DUF2071 domain-containing protein [Myxococcota bacterium]